MARQPKDQAGTTLAGLRRVIIKEGLVAELSGLDPREHTLVVSNRLAQTTLRYLLDIDGETGRALTEELRRLAKPEIYELLFEDRCYTYFHVVQFLYEFVKHHSSLPDRRYFAAGVGRGGGGLEVAPDREVVSLVALMTTALPVSAASRTIGAMMQMLGESQIAQALGSPARVRPPALAVAPALNRRQEEVLRCLAGAREGMVLEEVLAALPATGLGGGQSARTLQNDLGKLAEAGYLSWIKQGSARCYRLTPEGQRLLT